MYVMRYVSLVTIHTELPMLILPFPLFILHTSQPLERRKGFETEKLMSKGVGEG